MLNNAVSCKTDHFYKTCSAEFCTRPLAEQIRLLNNIMSIFSICRQVVRLLPCSPYLSPSTSNFDRVLSGPPQSPKSYRIFKNDTLKRNWGLQDHRAGKDKHLDRHSHRQASTTKFTKVRTTKRYPWTEEWAPRCRQLNRHGHASRTSVRVCSWTLGSSWKCLRISVKSVSDRGLINKQRCTAVAPIATTDSIYDYFRLPTASGQRAKRDSPPHSPSMGRSL